MTRDALLARLRALKPWLEAEYGVSRLAVFGSHARDEAGPTSDVDLLVTLAKPMGFRFLELEDRISDALGVKVDLVTETGLHPLVRETALRDAIRVV